MKLHRWQDIRREHNPTDQEKVRERLQEIAKELETATPARQKQLSKEIDKLLGTKAEESPDADLEQLPEESDED